MQDQDALVACVCGCSVSVGADVTVWDPACESYVKQSELKSVSLFWAADGATSCDSKMYSACALARGRGVVFCHSHKSVARST